MTNEEALALFEQAGALLTGHFLLSSGLHSDRYLEKFRLVENPKLADQLTGEIARRFERDRVEVVMGPTTAGIILAYNVARALGVEARFAEKEDGRRKLRRGQQLRPGTRVLVVDDILTTGGAVNECVQVVAQHEAELVGVGVLADRSGGRVTFPARLEAALTLSVDVFDPSACPQCAAGAPLTKPGTSSAR